MVQLPVAAPMCAMRAAAAASRFCSSCSRMGGVRWGGDVPASVSAASLTVTVWRRPATASFFLAAGFIAAGGSVLVSAFRTGHDLIAVVERIGRT